MTSAHFALTFSRPDTRGVRAVALGLFLGLCLGCNAGPAEPTNIDTVVTEVQLNELIPGTLLLPNTLTSVKFAVIGDSGRWSQEQRETAGQMAFFRKQFPFEFVLMLGDNIYEGPASPEDYLHKFEEPYADLREAGVDFYAALGNHDDPRQIDYPSFNMKGERTDSFAPPEDVLAKIATRVEFFALDTTNPDSAQLRWLDERLGASKAEWKICFFHHPCTPRGDIGRYPTSTAGSSNRCWYATALTSCYQGTNTSINGHGCKKASCISSAVRRARFDVATGRSHR